MQLVVKRLGDRPYETFVTRDDGVRFRVKGVGHMFAIPHDLAHSVVETALRIPDGFWGCVAAGAVFPSMDHLAGRRRPHAAERSRALLNSAIEAGLRPDSPHLRRQLDRHTVPGGRARRSVTDGEIAEVWRVYDSVKRRWADLPVGGTMTLDWPRDLCVAP